MEPIKTLASFVLRGLPYVSAFHFALFSFYSFLAFVVVVFLKDRNITLGKNIFWQLRSNQDWKKSRMWLCGMWDFRQMHCCKNFVSKRTVAFYEHSLVIYTPSLGWLCPLLDTHTGNDVIAKGLRKYELVLPWQLQYHQRPHDIKSG